MRLQSIDPLNKVISSVREDEFLQHKVVLAYQSLLGFYRHHGELNWVRLFFVFFFHIFVFLFIFFTKGVCDFGSKGGASFPGVKGA